jgi:hypothetical protein
MDFQRLFKRKEEGPARPVVRGNMRDTLRERDVLVREGELLDGKSPPPLLWSNVGGAISVKAEKILGIMEGRTRIKAEILHEVCPGLFGEPPGPGTEFTIPLQAVVMQLQDIFEGMSPKEADDEYFDTPFGQLAREDEARFKDKQHDHPEVRPLKAPQLYMHSQPISQSIVKESDQSTGVEKLTERDYAPEQKLNNNPAGENNGFAELQPRDEHFTCHTSNPVPKTFGKVNAENCKPVESAERGDSGNYPDRMVKPISTNEQFLSPLESRGPDSRVFSLSSGVRGLENNNSRREGLERLQELYLTDELLDGCKVSDLIKQLPGVSGVVIMLADGAVLGGGLSGALSETLVSLTPDFVTHLSGFTQSISGGPSRFVTFSGHGRQVSLSISEDALILVEHEGKNLPPGLRERLVATAQALNLIYGSQS